MTPKPFIIFDVDGTLMDSQHIIVSSMTSAFQACDAVAPDREAILSVVGLSLDEACARLHPEKGAFITEEYKKAFHKQREQQGLHSAEAPLYPGVMEMLYGLKDLGLTLGIATGKSRRGLELMLDAHQFRDIFSTTRTADDGEGKPHPAMVLGCCQDVDYHPQYAMVIGDTTYDMEMARRAGAMAVGVPWGYHSVDMLEKAGASTILNHWDELPDLIAKFHDTFV